MSESGRKMGKGRAPCCDKSKVKKGLWSRAEDLRLISFIQKHGHENWRALPKQAGLLRCGKSCRMRWINYLRPDIKRGNFTKDEEDAIIKMHQTMGNKWSNIAARLPGRTDNEIKNVWNTRLKKRLILKDQDSGSTQKSSATYSSSASSTTTTHKKKVNKESQLYHHENHYNRQNPDNNDDLVAKKPRVSGEETKEVLANSSSNSNNSTIIKCNISQSDVNQLMSQLLNGVSPPHFGEIRNILEEVNELEIQENPALPVQEPMEIPYELDVDFWNMLGGLNSSLPLEILMENEEDHKSINNHGSSSNLGEIENKKWLWYLENELELEATDRHCRNI